MTIECTEGWHMFVCLFVCISYSLSLQLIVHKCTVYAVINEIRLLASLQHELVTQALFEDYFCHSFICVIISRVHWYSVVRPLRRDLIHHNRVRHAAAWRMFFMPTAGFEPGSSGYKAAALPSVLSHLVLSHIFSFPENIYWKLHQWVYTNSFGNSKN